ncbi:MAG: hypothetical protein ACR2H0_05525 [Candidatus Limnocylindrales bacterium]
MEGTQASIEFTLRSEGGQKAVSVRLRRLAHGWVAEVGGALSNIGVGGSARQALAAGLQPFGDSDIRALLADLGLLEPSVAVLAIEAESRPA